VAAANDIQITVTDRAGRKCASSGSKWEPLMGYSRAVRKAIADNERAFRKLLAAPDVKRHAGALLGERLSRVPRGFDADHPAADLLRMKQWYFDVTLPAAAALASSIRKQVTTRFRAMAPVVHFLNNAALAAARDDADADERDAIPKRPAPMF